MNEQEPQNSNMSQQESEKKSFTKHTSILAVIIISAWIISMGILGAGWLISKELSNSSSSDTAEQDTIPAVVDIEIPESAPILGNPDAKVTIVEFADYNCPYCAQFHDEIFPQLKVDYIDSGKAKFVFIDLAFLGEESLLAAEATYCAKDQGKYWEYSENLFATKSKEEFAGFTPESLLNSANEVGLSEADFKSCTEARIHKPIVEYHSSLAEKYYVSSTPTLFANGVRLEGVMPYESYSSLIDDRLSN